MSRNYKMHNPEGIYFLTFTVIGWIDVFSRLVYKEILTDSLRHCIANKGLHIHAWVIMSNHVHLIASAEHNNLPDIVRDLKKYTSKKIVEEISMNPQESRREWMLAIFRNAGQYNRNNKEYQFWQQYTNKPVELYSKEVMQQKLNYIHDNPVVAGYVTSPEYYTFSSCIDYAGGKGLLEIDFLF